MLYSFCLLANCADGAVPRSSGVTLDAAGNFYGTTEGGGVNNAGTVFKLAPQPDGSWKESVLHHFLLGTGGNEPEGGVIFDAAGNLYGTTVVGGSAGDGVVFKMTPNPDGSWTYDTIHTFLGRPAAYPWTGVILDSAGNLYGTASGSVRGSGATPGQTWRRGL